MAATSGIEPRVVFIDAENGGPGGTDIPDLAGAAANQVRLLSYRELGTGATIVTRMLLRRDTLVTTADPPSYASLFEGRSVDRSEGEPLETANCQRQPPEHANLAGNIVYVTVVMLPLMDDIFKRLGIGLDQLGFEE